MRRRLVHLALIMVVIIGVRAFGGVYATEDRLVASSRWVGEKTGLTAAQEQWRTNVAPGITRFTGSIWSRTQQGFSVALERLGSMAENLPSGVAAGLSNAVGSVAAVFGGDFAAAGEGETGSGGGGPPGAEESGSAP